MNEWQSIETAPNNGDYVLLWAATWRHPFVGLVSATSHMAWLDIPTPTATQTKVFATHWMPLPDVPAMTGTQEQRPVRPPANPLMNLNSGGAA